MAIMERQPEFAGLTSALEDAASAKELSAERMQFAELVSFVEGRFQRSEDARLTDENRWLSAYRNYRGVYPPSQQFLDTERSRVFIKVTKTKVLAAYGQIVDVLFAGNKFPIGVEPTKVPLGVAAEVHFDPKAAAAPAEEEASPSGGVEDIFGFEGDGRTLPPGATIKDLLGPLQDDLEQLQVEEGPGQTPTALTFEPAKAAAERMQKKIHDQLEESDADKHLRYVAFEAALFGSGVLAGPFTYKKEYPRWSEDGTYEPEYKTMPKLMARSLWDIYPDPDAVNIAQGDYLVVRHKMTRQDLRALKKRPFFRPEAIEALIDVGPNYVRKHWENVLQEDRPQIEADRYEVMEYWGYLDTALAERCGVEIPDEMADFDEVQVNAWISGGQVLRLVLNPFTPARIPFYLVPYELNPYSPFGIGVAENMEDTQTLMNGFMRMAVDNGVLSGNMVFEVNEDFLTPGQDLKIFPGKVFRRQGGPPGQAIFGTKFPNVTQENLLMFDKARQLADEATGMPSFAHGQSGITGVGRTAAGISMLMGAASISVKTVIKNFDDYLLAPLGKAMFSWNMQFDFDPKANGDLEIKARGVESLLRNEVRSQRLMAFLQLVSQPALAPMAKFDYIIKELAKMLDLDPDLVVNSPAEMHRQAALMQQAGMGGEQQGAPPGLDPSDPTGAGGGVPGVGMVPTPGEPGFSGNSMGGPPPGSPPAGGPQGMMQ